MRTRGYFCKRQTSRGPCGGRIIFVMVANHDDRIYLLGKCVECSKGTMIDIQQIVTDALEPPKIGFDTDWQMPPDEHKN